MSDSADRGTNPFLWFRREVLVPGTGQVDPARAARVGLEVLKDLDPELDVTGLHGLFVASPEGYDELVRQVVRRIGASFPLRATHLEPDRAAAVTVKGEDEDAVVLLDRVAASLFSESGWRVAWNTLHHHLAHVHDDAKGRAGVPALSWMGSPAQAAALELAIALWSEYHASRRASQSFGEVTRHVPGLVRALRAYPVGDRSVRDLESVFGAAGRVLGELPVGSSNLMVLAPAAALVVLASPLGRIWPALPRVLDGMYVSAEPRTALFHEDLARLVLRFWSM